MKLMLCAALLFLFRPNLGYSEGFVRAKGTELVGPKGEPFLIKGTNLGEWLEPEGYMLRLPAGSPRQIDDGISQLIGPEEAGKFWRSYVDNYVTESDIRYLKVVGLNTVRLPFNYRLFTDEPYLGGSGEARGFAILDRAIGWCRKYGLYVILDMHAAPGGQTGDNIDDSAGYPFLLESEPDQRRTAEIWAKIAKRYRDEDAVLGYDLLNEPIASYFDADRLNPKLEPLYRRLVKAVREVDPNHVIFLGGAQWDGDFEVFGPPFDPNLAYTFHQYWMNPDQAALRKYLDFRDRYHVPIYMGESGENTDEWILRYRKILDSQRVGWTFWPYKRMRTAGDGRVKGARDSSLVEIKTPEDYDAIERYFAAPRGTYEEIRKARPKDMDKVRKTLAGLLDDLKFENCVENAGYRKALGF